MTNKPSSDPLQPNEKSHEQHILSCTLKRKRPPTIEIPNVLQEIQSNSLKVKDFTPRDDAFCFSRLGVAVYSVKGKSKFMEDAHKIVSRLHGNSNKDMVSGTCCVTALIEGDAVVVSNLGDCRAVLSRGGVAEAFTADHKAEQQDERTIIENKDMLSFTAKRGGFTGYSPSLEVSETPICST
ncbi:Detected protein of unknown function [Hibiscus syriacus]|uniref:PPM-type phosphatase domain-containing protein n=1 Tax=Hibiscus syriacus TaxID=106335 RepID=A0A6A2ZA42_HIBSY|nr:Detected protein of unknown function [Hibiscus syriacus]